ncbi:cation transporter [Microbacterium aureliae]
MSGAGTRAGGGPPVDSRRGVHQRRIRWIVAATISYNVIEAIVAISAGTVASSVALIGFGLDSTIEVLSAAAVAWQFTRRDPERWERPTLRVIAVAFFALAAWVSASSVLALTAGVEAEHSPVGIALTAVSVVAMPVLSFVERRTGRELGSATAVADSKQTLICAYLSGAVLVGLLLNSLLGWWWVDPIAALVIAGFAVREGIEAWRGDACATSVGMPLDDEHDGHEHDRHDHGPHDHDGR